MCRTKKKIYYRISYRRMTIIYTDLQSIALIYRVVYTQFSQTQIADKYGHELRSETSEQQFHTKHEKSNQSCLNGDFFIVCSYSFFFFICSVLSAARECCSSCCCCRCSCCCNLRLLSHFPFLYSFVSCCNCCHRCRCYCCCCYCRCCCIVCSCAVHISVEATREICRVELWLWPPET